MKLIKANSKVIVCLAALLGPVLFMSTRSIVLSEVSSRANIRTIKAYLTIPPKCDAELCRKVSKFTIESHSLIGLARPAFATYGAQLDSYIRLDGKDLDPVTKKIDLRITWPRFRIWALETEPNSGQNISVDLVAVAPSGTFKIGMEVGVIYVGEKRSLELVQFIYSLYNIHSYLLLALSILGISLFFIFSSNVSGDIKVLEVIKKTFVFSGATVLFSTIFDDLFIAIGLPITVVPNLSQLLWGPAVLLAIFEKGWLRFSLICLWVGRVALSSFIWKYRDFFFYGTYRWAVLLVIVLSVAHVVRRRQSQFAAPFLCVAFWDYLCLIGYVPLKSAAYFSPLGFFGLFVAAHIDYLAAIVAHHIYWYERKQLSISLQELRRSNSVDRNQWLALLSEFCTSMGGATGASKISLCYLGFDSPLIVSLDSGKIRMFEDGQLPPVFARVIQTKESLWWITDEELAAFLPGNSLGRKDLYKSKRAVVLPILVGGEAYGAISLTDFRDLESIVSSQDRCHQIESIITSFLDLISIHLVKNKEASSSQIQKKANELVRTYSAAAIYARTREEAIEIFLTVFTKQIRSSAMYFDFEAATERLHLVAAVNMPNDQVAQWRQIPFRARPTNRIGPFAIAINERRSVYVENIRSFFNFLTPQSIDVLSASGTKGFVCAPVCFGDKVMGLLCALDTHGSEPLNSEVAALLDLPLTYLAYQLQQHLMSSELVTQEKALSRFSDPRLSKLIAEAQNSDELAIGDTSPAVIIIHDMRGSTDAARKERDAKKLAGKFARVYEKAASIAFEFGASYDKGNGDGTITTMSTGADTNGSGLLLALRLLDEVHVEAKSVLGIHGSIVCVHRGEPFRGILGTTRRVAWDICGVDVIDAFSIEKVAKKFDGVVFAVSAQIVDLESSEIVSMLKKFASHSVLINGLSGAVLMYDAEAVRNLRTEFENSALRRAA